MFQTIGGVPKAQNTLLQSGPKINKMTDKAPSSFMPFTVNNTDTFQRTGDLPIFRPDVPKPSMPVPATEVGTKVSVDGNPFMAVPSPDGKALYVSVQSDDPSKNGVQVFQMNGEGATKGQFIPVKGNPAGMSLSKDGQTLFVTNQHGFATVNVNAPKPSASYTVLPDTPGDSKSDVGTLQIKPSPDGKFVYFSNEWDQSVGVAKLVSNGQDGGPPKYELAGKIPVNPVPVGMDLSPDGRYLYVTSQSGANGNPDAPGTLSVIDTQKAKNGDYTDAVVASVPAGLDPVRVELSPDGKVAWVTARGSNKVLKFDTNALRTDPSNALLDTIATGDSPVGISTFGEDGSHLLVANSDRFNPNASASTAVVIDTGSESGESPTITQTIATGSFPREITESADHNYLFLTNYKSGEVQIIPQDELIL